MEVVNRTKGKNVYGTCNFCKSELKINTFDLKFGFFTVYFRCPVCNKKIIIPDDKLYLFGIQRGNSDN